MWDVAQPGLCLLFRVSNCCVERWNDLIDFPIGTKVKKNLGSIIGMGYKIQNLTPYLLTIFYAVRPFPWRDKFPKASRSSRELRDKTIEKFKDIILFPRI